VQYEYNTSMSTVAGERWGVWCVVHCTVGSAYCTHTVLILYSYCTHIFYSCCTNTHYTPYSTLQVRTESALANELYDKCFVVAAQHPEWEYSQV
jgi:hypothetical protein